MEMQEIIAAKRDGNELTRQQLHEFVAGVTEGSIPEYQTAALLMAIYLRGMTPRETAWLTAEIRDSGDRLDLSRFGGRAADKHSTGGVGDKTTLIVAPLAASLGAVVAKMSGRGLGHTGGTVDKLESIPGYRVELSPQEFMEQAARIGVAVVGQSGHLAPADKKLYALRDVTATVASIPLIASSIMSKKLAAGADCIVLDVKTGSGAFMKTPQEAEQLARAMVEIGASCGRKVSALITNMDVPLGRAVGNALEVREAVEVLSGGGDAALREICVTLAAHMAALCRGWSAEQAHENARKALSDGSALARFRTWIAAQGGDPAFIDTPETLCPARCSRAVRLEARGYLHAMDAQLVGRAAMALGAGREKLGDCIDYSAGVLLAAKTGDPVPENGVVATLYTADEGRLDAAEELLRAAFTVDSKKPKLQPLIYQEITR